jgi:2-methylcitrate dehydratase PrpD
MTYQGTAHPFDRRLFFLAGTGALALLTTGGAVLAQGEGGKAAASGRRLRQVLADFVVGFDLKQVPPEVIERARVAFIDTIGVSVAGSHEEVAHIVAEMVKAEGSSPQCTIVGQSLRASPQLAALANGVANHAMDYDFTFLSGQAVAPLIPALLPVAETMGATPSDVLGAFIVGCEVAARIVRSSPRLTSGGGWHTTGIVGGIAAAAGCAKLMKLPVDKVANAIGISVSLGSGLPVNYGTMTKPLHCGNAARGGVMAALLASKDFTSHAAAFEGNNGFYRTFGRALPTDFAPFNDLGKRWDLVTTGYAIKNYPSGGRGHTAIEATLILRDKLGARASEIANIHCSVSPSSATRVNADYPADVEASKFSAAYVIAYSLVHGVPKIKAFTPEALKDERVRAMAKLVTAGGDPNLSDALGENPARIKITLKDGATFEHQRDYPTGSPQLPMTPKQVEEKFMDCATQTVSADSARKLFAIVSTFDKQSTFGEFWTLIRKA